MDRRISVMAAVAGLIWVGGTAAPAQYQPKPLLGAGFTDKQLAQDRWQVRGFSPDRVDQHAVNTALYRAAILVKRAGYSHFQVVNSSITITQGAGSYHQNATFTVVGTSHPDVTIACEAKPQWQDNCRLLSADEVLSRLAIVLARNPDADLSAK